MDKTILNQYIDLKAEIADLEQRICQMHDEMKRLESGKIVVSDSVKGTRLDGTYGSIRITGYPYASSERIRRILKRRQAEMECFREELLSITADTEEYIDGIADPRIRRMLRYRYFDGLSWVQVAHRMGGKHTADSCRKQIERILKEN